jgi:hypothetical protein
LGHWAIEEPKLKQLSSKWPNEPMTQSLEAAFFNGPMNQWLNESIL